MSRLNWDRLHREEKAARSDLAENRAARRASLSRSKRQLSLDEFVAKRDLACFKCGAKTGPWAKTGSTVRGPWAICVSCLQAS